MMDLWVLVAASRKVKKEGPTKAHLSTVWTVWCGTLGHRYGMFNTAHHSPGNAEGCVARLNMFSKAMSSNNDPLGKLQQQDVPFCRQQCVQIWAGKTPLMTILTYMLSADLEYSFRQNYKISQILKIELTEEYPRCWRCTMRIWRKNTPWWWPRSFQGRPYWHCEAMVVRFCCCILVGDIGNYTKTGIQVSNWTNGTKSKIWTYLAQQYDLKL